MKEYTASNLDKCLELAALDMRVTKKEIEYEIIKESKSFFKKSITIAIKEASFELEITKENEKPSEVRGEVLSIEISPCRTKAYLIIEYEQGTSDKYTEDEVIKLIEDKNIIYDKTSIIFSQILKEGGRYKIAEGIEAVDDEEDIIDIKFLSKKVINDSTISSINYKEICTIDSVNKEDILASIKRGKEGNDGIDVFGRPIKRKRAKKHLFKAGSGCILQESGDIIASISGKPSYKSGVISVNELYEHRKNVDIESGSLYFHGHVKIYGSVLSGMTVEAKGDVEILGSVEEANINALGDITIHGNVLKSNIAAGGNNNFKNNIIRLYRDLASNLTEMKRVVEEIKKYKLLGDTRSDGQIIKVLMESKFQRIDACTKEILSTLNHSSNSDELIKKVIKGKLIGLGPIAIKDYSELDTIIKILIQRIKELQEELNYRSSVNLQYIQDCEVSASGKITIKGRGEYQCYITSGTVIEFANGAIARGGRITASQEIIAGKVGSGGGVLTKLVVDKTGIIKVNKIFQNTSITIGDKELLIDNVKERIKAVLGKDGFIDIENYY